jgi:hypothetical protein
VSRFELAPQQAAGKGIRTGNDSMELKPTCSEVHRLTSEGLDWKLSMIDHACMRQLRIADESGTEREPK